jgi:hypothetical protein
MGAMMTSGTMTGGKYFGLIDSNAKTVGSIIRLTTACALVAAGAFALKPQISVADEGGVSFWLPGIYGSLASAPQQPGWSFGAVYYHTTLDANGAVSAARQVTRGQLTANVSGNLTGQLNASADLALLVPTYTFATPVLGGQLALGMMAVTGRMKADVDATLTGSVGPFGFTRSGSFGDSVSGFGDLYPQATMRWNLGVHNFMAYATGDIPVGAYDPTRLANLGIGHGAIDGGGGYTYFNPQTGHEFSAVGGFTYNLKNTDTQYQNGIDFHLDGALSQFLSKQLFVGVVGYTYQQITADSGALPILEPFKSRVSALGPQIGYLFPVGDMQGYLNVKGYKEFDAANRPSGWNTWLTFAISPAAAPAPVRPTSQLVHK